MKPIYFICLFLVVASCKKTEQSLTKITAKNIVVDSTLVASPTIENVISPYKEKLVGEMERVLTYSAIDLTKQSTQLQSTLGNLVADLSVEMANPLFTKTTTNTIDFAMFNSGGLRASIAQGNVTKESAFKLMPFDNELVVVTLTGDKIDELIQYFIRNQSAHPLSKNIALLITENGYDLKIGGKKFDSNKIYNVLTSDYLQTGGDGMDFFKNPKQLTNLNYKVRDAVIDYFEKMDTLQVAIDNRVKIE
ncbi:5'-nucleotidase C-terminal domain-containing protein [Polaribacter sp. Hel_I_88]|uniref:5'-nucleotidase C-terminal domain-containing protein n=1 Tax=Polaribacter sp. Hel_I_88 TaxID=1250006 RepID=UPI0004788B43|nr:5'-nucleotidase C-terminal domain-containing protein [Polaribacter sp. Hel_I_88]